MFIPVSVGRLRQFLSGRTQVLRRILSDCSALAVSFAYGFGEYGRPWRVHVTDIDAFRIFRSRARWRPPKYTEVFCLFKKKKWVWGRNSKRKGTWKVGGYPRCNTEGSRFRPKRVEATDGFGYFYARGATVRFSWGLASGAIFTVAAGASWLVVYLRS